MDFPKGTSVSGNQPLSGTQRFHVFVSGTAILTWPFMTKSYGGAKKPFPWYAPFANAFVIAKATWSRLPVTTMEVALNWGSASRLVAQPEKAAVTAKSRLVARSARTLVVIPAVSRIYAVSEKVGWKRLGARLALKVFVPQVTGRVIQPSALGIKVLPDNVP